MKGSGLIELKLKVDGLGKCIVKEAEHHSDTIKKYLEVSVNSLSFVDKLTKEYHTEEQWYTLKALSETYYRHKDRLDEYKEYELIKEV